MKNNNKHPRILFTSPWGFYPKRSIDDDPIDIFYYRNTFKQGIYQLRCFQSWHSLHFLAQNLNVASTVLENPSPRQFKREMMHGGYRVVAISFNLLLAEKTLEMCRWLKSELPEVMIIVGGYGTAIFKDNFPIAEQLRYYVDDICPGEGVSYFKKLLFEKWKIEHNEKPFMQKLLPNIHSLIRTRIPLFKQLVFVRSLGCEAGCNFCATSYHFKKKVVELFTGEELFTAIKKQSDKFLRIKSAIIYDEDFLANPDNVNAFKKGFQDNPELYNRGLLFTVFASVRSVQQYSIRDLIECGIGTLYIGVESFLEETIENEKLKKRIGQVKELFSDLHTHGINTLGSLIIGWDSHDEETARSDVDQFVKLNPTFYQVVPLHPVPGTPLWAKISKEKRFNPGYRVEKDSIGEYNYSLMNMTNEFALSLVMETYKRLVDEGGPWPFRIAENLYSGYLRLNESQIDTFKKRAETYGQTLNQILPFALISGFIFKGKNFLDRWSEFKVKIKSTYGIRYYLFWISGLSLTPVIGLLFFYGWIKYHLNPHGDQPNRVKVIYTADNQQ